MATANQLQSRIAELEALQRRTAQIAVVQMALSQAAAEQDILAAVATIAEGYGAVGSAMAYTETDAEGNITGAKVVAMQFAGQPVAIADVLPTDDYPLDSNPILKIALDNPDEPLFVENIFTDPRTEVGTTREAFRHTGMTATVILWFRAAGRVQGVMTFNWPDEQPFNEDMRAVFKAIQPVASAVIANRRLMLDMEQRVAERTLALQASEQRLAQAQQAGGIGVWELNLQTSELYWSDIMYELTGRDPAQGVPASDQHLAMIVPEDRDMVNTTIAEAVQNGVPFKLDYRIMRQDGTVRYVTSSGYGTFDAAGQLSKLVGTMQDMTDRKLASDALRQSQRMLQTVLDTIPVRVFWKDNDLRYLGCNRLFAGDAGVESPEQIIGKSDYDVSWAEVAELYRADDRAVIESGVARINFEEPQNREDGTQSWLRTSKTPLVDAEGRIFGVLGMYEDITERKQAGDALRQSQQMLQTVLDTIPVRVFWKDADSRFIGCNRLFAMDMGCAAPEELIGKSDYDFAAKVHADSYRADDLKVMEARQPRLNYEEQLMRSDGTEIWLRTSKIPLMDAAGQSIGILGVYDDITVSKLAVAERDHLQQQIIEAQRQALAELSTPIIPIMDRIIVMPLVGAIDTARSRDIMRSLLSGISQYRAQVAILDITGVPVVDSGVADHLNRTIQAARLKGAQTIITGISDAVAETIVDLGIDWGEIETLRDLQTGLVMALERIGVRLVQRSNGEKRA